MTQSTPLDQLGGMESVSSSPMSSTPLPSMSSSSPSGPTIPSADEERVKRIMAELNAEGSVQAPPGFGSSARVITEPPISVSTGDIRMDPGTARAHVIGNSSPSLADFQSLFQQTPPGTAPIHGNAVYPSMPVKNGAPRSIKQSVTQMLRGPLAVAFIVFFLSLPVVTNTLSRYASWMYLSSGEISIPGLFMKALLAAAMFAVYQIVSSLFLME